jgi:hypothetical protein
MFKGKIVFGKNTAFASGKIDISWGISFLFNVVIMNEYSV